MINNTDPGLCTWTAPVGSLTPLLVTSNCPATVAYTISGATTASGSNDASGEVFNLGISTVTYTVTETASGQSWECSFTVTIVDEQNPTITCPADITQNTDNDLCTAKIVLTLPVVSDNCTASPTITYRVFNADNSISAVFASASNTYTFQTGISQVEWTVTDAAGNTSICVQAVTISDNQHPDISCAGGSPFSRSNTIGTCGYKAITTEFDATASDNCTLIELSHNYSDWSMKAV